MQQHPADYLEYLSGRTPNSETVKYFICENVFLKYVGKAAAIVMFLLATMSIIELLNNNGCFDFISEWIRTRNSKRLLWTITLATFIISANLDNLTTTTMMLVIMNNVLQSGRQRMLVGSAIVLAATCGGCFTVIGDPVGLILWGDGVVTASHFSAYMLLPALIAWIVPTMLINRELPDRLDTEWIASPYRGDDTRLNRWQRLVMLFVGIGGLWFIPTFHNITKLSPFLGALCVLSGRWLVNEACNRRLMNADQMAQRRIPRALQYGTIQQILFVMGIMMGMGVMLETGVLGDIGIWLAETFHNNWLLGIGAGLLSAVADSFTVGLNHIMLYPLAESGEMAVNGAYWMIMVFSTAVGGCLLCVGSVSGVALVKMEHVRLGWYLRHLTSKVAVGWLLGLAVLWAELHLL